VEAGYFRPDWSETRQLLVLNALLTWNGFTIPIRLIPQLANLSTT
jgi:hypothetical protein